MTWVAYTALAWFAYLQAAPGLVIPHLREELHLSYATGGLLVAAFASGSVLAGLSAPRVERALGRAAMLWTASAVLAAGALGLVLAPSAVLTIASVGVMGYAGGLMLVAVQAALVDHHGPHSAVALTEANVAASVSYVVLIGALALTAALGGSWRLALVASLGVPALLWLRNRRLPIAEPAVAAEAAGRLPRLFWIGAAMLVCTTAAEWCITGWGATFAQDAVELSADAAVTVMAGYFGGVLVGRTVGSRLTRRYDPAHLLAAALVVSAVGFFVLWPATSTVQAVAGLALLGIGLGNLFPLAISVVVELAPGQAAQASGRAVAVTSFAVLLAPLTVGALADATSLEAAFVVVPVVLALASAGLVLVQRGRG
jgi:fucose permease